MWTKKYFLLFLCLAFASLNLYAEEVETQTALESATQLEYVITKPGKDSRIHLPEVYPDLKDISVKLKQRRVDLFLTGEYPALETVKIDSKWGDVWGHFEGKFSNMDEITVRTISGRVVLDLRGEWEKSCKITVESGSGVISIKVPTDVAIALDASSELGKVYKGDLKRRRWWSKELYVSSNFDEAPVVLELHLKTKKGNIAISKDK